jgi:hypothetical protein
MHKWEQRNVAYTKLIKKFHRRRPIERLRYGWKDTVEMDLITIGLRKVNRIGLF